MHAERADKEKGRAVTKSAFVTGENTRFPQVKVAETASAAPLKLLAAYCWRELDFYRAQLGDPGCDEFADFCRGAIKANERLLAEMERIEAECAVT